MWERSSLIGTAPTSARTGRRIGGHRVSRGNRTTGPVARRRCYTAAEWEARRRRRHASLDSRTTRTAARQSRFALSGMPASGDGQDARGLILAHARLAGTSFASSLIELPRGKHTLLAQQQLKGVQPPLVVRGVFVGVRRHALYPATQLVHTYEAPSSQRTHHRVREQLPVGQLVLAPVDALLGRPASSVMNRPCLGHRADRNGVWPH